MLTRRFAHRAAACFIALPASAAIRQQSSTASSPAGSNSSSSSASVGQWGAGKPAPANSAGGGSFGIPDKRAPAVDYYASSKERQQSRGSQDQASIRRRQKDQRIGNTINMAGMAILAALFAYFAYSALNAIDKASEIYAGRGSLECGSTG